MKSYRITVNGIAYDVQVEETASAPVYAAPAVSAPVAAPAAPAAPAVPQGNAPAATQEKAVPAGNAPVNADGEKVNAPMPGTIIKVNVKVGDTVSEKQALLVLEAMKMENDIIAPKAGTVAAIAVAAGDSVNAGQVLAVIA